LAAVSNAHLFSHEDRLLDERLRWDLKLFDSVSHFAEQKMSSTIRKPRFFPLQPSGNLFCKACHAPPFSFSASLFVLLVRLDGKIDATTLVYYCPPQAPLRDV
jgi:hypothetical protein